MERATITFPLQKLDARRKWHITTNQFQRPRGHVSFVVVFLSNKIHLLAVVTWLRTKCKQTSVSGGHGER
jgi:hypothetical protein